MHPFIKNSKENGVLNYIRVLLAVSIVLSTFNPVLVASASSGIELSISSDKVIKGDIANVVISLANCENVTGVNMTLVYDESIVSLNSITKNTSVMSVHSVSSNDLGSGKVSISISGLDTIPTVDTPVIDVAMNGDVSGNSDMKLEGIEFITTDSSVPNIDVYPGQINVNSAPVFNDIGNQVVNETETLTLSLSATDADNDDLVYSRVGFGDLTANEFSWTPASGENGTYAINFTVSDGYEEGFENITVTVNVKPTPSNSAPVFDAIDDINTTVGNLVDFTIYATDVDNDPLTYYNNSILPEGAMFYPDNQSFVWTPSSNGTYNVNFGVDDGNGGTDSLVVSIIVDDVVVATNNPPVLTPIGDRSVNESELLAITLNATDIDGDSLTYSSNASFGNITTSNVFTWTPDYNSSGIYAVNFSVSDGNGGADSEIINITVNDVVVVTNSAPVFTPIADRTVNESDLLMITLNATDVDGDLLAYSSNASFGNITGDVFSWTPDSSDIGTHYVNFSVTDNEFWDYYVAKITVTKVNTAPVLEAIGPQYVDEGQELAFTLNGTDDDAGDILTYNVTGLPSGATLDSISGDFSWTPDYDMADDYTANFSVTDGIETVYQEATITVENTNRAPQFPPFNTQYVDENSTMPLLDVGATDPDNDSLTYSCNASFGTFDNVNHTFTWTPGFDDAGIHYVKFTVADTSTEDNLVVTFDVTNVNRIPVFRAIADQTVSEGNTLSFTVNATDDDGTALTYSAIVLPSGATFDSGSGDFTWTPGYNMNGSYTANFSVSDGESIVYQEIGITVTNTNRAPVLDYIQSVSVNETENVTITLNAIDPDGDSPLYYSMNSSKGNLDDNVFTWTPGYEDKGIHHINFTVSDGDLSSTQMAVIGVNNTNRAPEFTSIVGTQIINEGGNISFKVTAADADGDDLTYSVSGDPETSTIEFTSTGITFNWSPSYTEAGNYTITFIVKDEMLYSDTLKVPIQVLDVNRAPRFTLNSSYEINETNTLTIDLDPYDEDTDDVVSVWINNTGNASGSLSSSGVYTWNTDYYDSGIYNIEFGISDGTVTSYSNTTVTVNDVNAPPVLSSIGSQSVDEEAELTINLTATDIDGNSLEFTIENKPENATFDTSTGNFSWTPIDGETGTYYVLFGVTDGTDIDTENVTIKVTSGSSSSSSSSSSGGGGGGGGGSLSSGEKFENIFIKDYVLKSIVKDSEAVFSFYEENNSIVSVSFTPKLNGGQVKAVVEMLYGTSSQVSSDAPGNVYKNMNIYVDTKLSADSMGNSKINFKVEKEWVDENEIDLSTITLCRYSGGWTELPTELKGEDEEYYYFIATTPGFSPFAISSIDPALEVTEEASAEATDESAENAESMMSTEDVGQEISTETQQEGQSSIVPVIVLLGVIALTIVGIFGYRNRDYYEKVRLQLGNPDGKRYRRTKK